LGEGVHLAALYTLGNEDKAAGSRDPSMQVQAVGKQPQSATSPARSSRRPPLPDRAGPSRLMHGRRRGELKCLSRMDISTPEL
jgi:hypothetical protein